jgi:methylglutaconyl-CoA hydratase
MPGEVVVERRDQTEWLTISSPPRNLLAPDIMRELAARLEEADADDDVRAIVLTGAGNVFCGGLDVEALNAGADPVEFAEELVALLHLPPKLGKPLVGAINGDALASGFSLVVITDWAIAVQGAKLGTFEASIGIWPMIAQVPPLQRLLPRHALSNILTGNPFPAQRALEVGAVNAVVPAAELEAAVEAQIPIVTRASASALAAGRRAFYRFVDMPYEEALDASLAEFTAMFQK